MVLLLAACTSAGDRSSDTSLPDGSARWSADLRLEADYVVAEGESLTIEPGVTVALDPGVALIVQGELVARGTAESPITFTGDSKAPWRSVVFEDSASDAVFVDLDAYEQGSIVEYAVLEHATRAMELQGASPYLAGVTFRENVLPTTVDTVGGAALLIAGGATPRVRDCTFQDNVANLFAFGGAVYVQDANPILQDNVYLANAASYGGAISTDRMAAPIVGSWFSGNRSESEGGGVSLVSTVSALLNDTFVGNEAATDGGGVHVCTTCDPHAVTSLLDVRITGNTSEAEDPDEGAAGLGAAWLGTVAGLDLYDNLRAGVEADLGWFHPVAEGWPTWASSPTLSQVWWGTTSLEDIEAAVWDGLDNAEFGVVTIDSIGTEPIGAPLPRVVVATRRQHYDIEGDEMAVYLTVYNPGAAAEFAISLAYEVDGEPRSFPGEVGLPGASREGDTWAISLPENAVWFGTIDSGSWDAALVEERMWTATLSDAGGATIGVPSVAHALLGGE